MRSTGLGKAVKHCVSCLKRGSQRRRVVNCSNAVVVVLIILLITRFRYYLTVNRETVNSLNTFEVEKTGSQPYKAPSNQIYYLTKGTTIESHTRVVKHFELDGPENRSIELLMSRGVVVPASDQISSDTKIILWLDITRYHPKLSRLHPLRGCPEKSCRITTNGYFFNQSDAVVFAVQRLTHVSPTKFPNQVWVLHSHGSPRWSKAFRKRLNLYTEEWNWKFNWTLNYRDDADLKAPYGLFRKNGATFEKRWPPVVKNYTDIMGKKFSTPNAEIAWMVSNCKSKSKRRKYALELSKYVKIDIFGECGTRHCPRADDDKCFDYLSTHYKFYLGFENAFCKDYITEKMFRFYKSDMVMIVRGGGNYSRVTPPGTYINTADFRSPKHLAQYLNMLSVSDNAYLDILQEKDKFEPIFEEWPEVENGRIIYMSYHYHSVPMCQLCDRLHNLDKFQKHYENITSWFQKGICYIPKDI